MGKHLFHLYFYRNSFVKGKTVYKSYEEAFTESLNKDILYINLDN